jgi:ribosomal protein S18 acetylase RimI-like enzyme
VTQGTHRIDDGGDDALPEPFLPLPELPPGWSARVPASADLPRLAELRSLDKAPWTGSRRIDGLAVESEVIGPKSWTRRQVVALDGQGAIRAWVTVHDRAAGRTMVHLYVDRSDDVPVALGDEVAGRLYAWAEDRARDLARLREVEQTRLDASPFEDDERQLAWLVAAGYARQRVWLHMSRPVEAEAELPPVREGVAVRRVASHDNGLPVAGDLQIVHEMLEMSFQDHFNSYRESFPEFVQRLREDPGHRWDHWWLAFVSDGDGVEYPAGAIVCSVLPPNDSGKEGSYVEYIGVNRLARGRGVAKGLLHTVIADAAARGRDRVVLEVDADSPTNADALYRSLGW